MARPYLVLGGDIGGTAAAPTIANDAITYAKMQNVSATDKVLGRSTAGAGDVEEIACTAAGRALLDDADAAAQRTTLGLGAAALLADPIPGASGGAVGNIMPGGGFWRSPTLTTSSTFLGVSGTAYFVYIGLVRVAFTPTQVEVHVSTKASGAQTAEVGLFSTPAAPNGAGQTLTKLVASGSLDDLTSADNTRCGNSSALATSVAAGTYLWAGIRTAMATTQPTYVGLIGDMGFGAILRTAAATAFTSGNSYTGALVTIATTANSPDIRVVG